ncbi:MAG: tyrosine-type recombinase/integrase [Vicinamibacterales bacterium]
MKTFRRRLADGREVDVGRNRGIRKICRCPRAKQAKCSHPWYFNFSWKRLSYRLSLDRHTGGHVAGRGEAEALADTLRASIRAGTFAARQSLRLPAAAPPAPLTFRAFADDWARRRGYQLVRAKDNDYRLKRIHAFELPGSSPPTTFGDKSAADVTTGDIEAYRHHRRAQGVSPVTSNHDLKLLRKMFAWGVRERLIPATPFKVGTESVIALDPETPRERRFGSDADETRLLRAANPHLRGILVAMLDTCCRPGEILSLQWGDVDLAGRELVIRAEKAKTRRARRLPISTRLLAVLQMRRTGPDGRPFGPEAYVFGDALGGRVVSIRTAWEAVRQRAGLEDFHLADLRHEAASRLEDAGVPTTYVSKFLGHRNLTTTTRYLNATIRGLRQAVEKLEASRASAARTRRKAAALANALQTPAQRPSTSDSPSDESIPPKSLIS